MLTPQIYSYEESYIQAKIIVRGNIVSFSNEEGAILYVEEVFRGRVVRNLPYKLNGSAHSTFLTALPNNIIAFIYQQDSSSLTLWQAPTNGGLIWSDPDLYYLIARAFSDPLIGIKSTIQRERLAAAFFLTTCRESVNTMTSELVNSIMLDVIWGISQSSENTNQTALNIFKALGYSLEAIEISYHPYFKDELKIHAANQLQIWWDHKSNFAKHDVDLIPLR